MDLLSSYSFKFSVNMEPDCIFVDTISLFDGKIKQLLDMNRKFLGILIAFFFYRILVIRLGHNWED